VLSKAQEQPKEELEYPQQPQEDITQIPKPKEEIPITQPANLTQPTTTFTTTIKIGSDEPDLFSILADSTGADEINFQDLDKLSDLPSVLQPIPDICTSPQTNIPMKDSFIYRRARPVASDFMDAPPDRAKKTTPLLSQKEEMSWRRNAHPPEPSPRVGVQSSTAHVAPDLTRPGKSNAERTPVVIHRSSDTKGALTVSQIPPDPRPLQGSGFPHRHERDLHTSNHPHEKHSRSTSSQWRENSLSTLNDAMSRIRGALDGLHLPTELLVTSKESSPQPPDQPINPKSLPAIGYRHAASPSSGLQASAVATAKQTVPREIFDTTRAEPPSMPKPAWNTFSVKLPRSSQILPEPLNKKQQGYFQIPHGTTNWGILTFAPYDVFSKRTLDRDGILFQKSSKYKYKPPRVQIPSRRLINSTLDRRLAEAARPLLTIPAPVPLFRVILPKTTKPKQSNVVKGTWTFGTSRASDAPLWRRPRIGNSDVSSLETRSRSPPTPTNDMNIVPKVKLSKGIDSPRHYRNKSEPRLPPGVAIAFASSKGGSQISLDDPTSTFVSFTVTSEIENPVVDPKESSTLIDPVIRPPDEQARQVRFRMFKERMRTFN
jgi:serine/arginine repetitive matrix protein 2